MVEDQPAIQELLTLVLRTLGTYTVFCATSGAEALDVIPACRPDLLLLDYHLPDMTGLQLYDRLHAQQAFQRLPAILISATLPPLELEKRRLIGLGKPFRVSELQEAITQTLLR